MEILEEIREYFASIKDGARKISSLPREYISFVIRINNIYGVAIPYSEEKDISEKFENCRLYTKKLTIEGEIQKYLILSCHLNSLRYEFAAVCAQFVAPGYNGTDRKNLLDNPLEWWKQWRNLLGDSVSDTEVYSVIAEMLVLDKLYETDNTAEWAAVSSGSHDIESNTGSFEVKSTIKRYGATITISGQNQLKSKKNLKLYFCRLEKSKEGISINEMKNKLISHGYSEDKIEQQLNALGYEYGASVRDEKYKVLEKRIYEVGDEFPKITEDSFKNNSIPKFVIQIIYTIDLDGLSYTVW